MKAEFVYYPLSHMRTYYRAPRMVPILNGYTNYRAVSTKISVLVAKIAFCFVSRSLVLVVSKKKISLKYNNTYFAIIGTAR